MLNPYPLVLVDKIVLGLLLAAPMGPVSLEMIKRGLSSGFWSSFSIRLGGGVANLLCLALTCFGLSQISQWSFLVNSLGFIGVSLLFYLGYTTLRQDINFKSSVTKNTVSNGLFWGFYLGIFNPVALAFWPGIFASSLTDSQSVGILDFFQNSLILVGILLWGAGLSFVASLGQRFLNLSKLRTVTKISGVLILLYGFKSLYHMLDKINFF